MSNLIRITYTESEKVTHIHDCTPEQFAARLAKGDFANLRLEQPTVRIEHGVAAGVKFVSKGYIPNPTPALARVAQVAFQEQLAERAAKETKRHETKPGDTLVIGGREYVIGEDGEPVLVSGTEPKKRAKKPKKQEVEDTDPADATGDTEPAASEGATDPAE